jgi:hypothetical protein
MTRKDAPETLSFTPRPAAIWQAEHERHEERTARGLLLAVLAGIGMWAGIAAVVTRCG